MNAYVDVDAYVLDVFQRDDIVTVQAGNKGKYKNKDLNAELEADDADQRFISPWNRRC